MTIAEDRIANPTAPISGMLVNEKREPYWVSIEMPRKKAGAFLLAMWREVMGEGDGPRDEEQALHEWTDRGRCVRSTFGSQGVCIRTHAWHHSGDRKTLHKDVLEFLRSRGLEL